MSTMNKVRAWHGPAVLSYGFRPFFLLAAAWAALAMILWIALLTGHAVLPTRFDVISWHAHEFVFGYAGAVISGFLLTAVPNWTGRLPVVGFPLAGLVALWVAGRIAVSCSIYLPPWGAALIDMAHLGVLAAVLAREIAAGRNWKNLPVLGALLMLVLANGLFHFAADQDYSAGENAGLRLGIATEVLLIALIGGRIVPSFTRNWLSARKSEFLPSQWNSVDKLALAATAAALVAFVVHPEGLVTSALSLLAGCANVLRLARWQGQRTLQEPLLWVLHLGYGFVALGFIAVAAAAVSWLDYAAALHVWLAGGVGLMTLAVMTRATRGHTGQPLTASPATVLIYVLIVAAVISRLAAAEFSAPLQFLYAASLFWIAAFVVFLIAYGPLLLSRKKSPAS